MGGVWGGGGGYCTALGEWSAGDLFAGSNCRFHGYTGGESRVNPQ